MTCSNVLHKMRATEMDRKSACSCGVVVLGTGQWRCTGCSLYTIWPLGMPIHWIGIPLMHWRTTFCVIRWHNRHILFMQFTLFYTKNCLYIIFVIFLIYLQLASKVNVSLTKMLQLLCPQTMLGVCPRTPLRGLPSPDPLTWRTTFKNAPPRL